MCIRDRDNGDLVFCGYITDDASGSVGLRSNIWLVRTTPDGCLDINNCDNITPTEDLALEPQPEFILYPNPVDTYVTIALDDLQNFDDWNIRVFNASGQLQSIAQTNEFPFQLNTEELAAGFYFLELSNKNGTRQMVKFVRQ